MLPAILATGLFAGCDKELHQEQAAAPPVRCEIDAGPCRQRSAEVTVTLDVSPRPVRTMTELTFRVTALSAGRPAGDEAVALELTMPGMQMGEHRIVLAAHAPGQYEGRGVIVRCPSGGRRWRATVFSPTVPHLSFDFMVDAP